MARIVGWLENLGALLLFAMMGVVFVDVGGRYLFGRPLVGSTEIVQMLLAASVVCILPSVTRRGEHIAIGLFEGVRENAAERLRRVLVAALGAATFGALSWLLWGHAGETAANGDVIGYLRLPVAPVVYVMSVLSGVTAVVFGALAARTVRDARGRRPAADPAPAAPRERLS